MRDLKYSFLLGERKWSIALITRPQAAHPPQTQLLTGRAVFTEAYAVIPRGVMMDIVTSYLPFWEETRAWVIARPLSGFRRNIFAIYHGSAARRRQRPAGTRCEARRRAVRGRGRTHRHASTARRIVLTPGGFAFLPPGSDWTPAQPQRRAVRVSLDPQGAMRRSTVSICPSPLSSTRQDIAPICRCPDTDGKWATTRFVDPPTCATTCMSPS